MHDNKEYSRSFDIMMRCNEISCGAQRIHDPIMLKQAILNKGIKIETSGLEDYIKSFEMGSIFHGGCGIGIERLIMLYLGLSNVRMTSLFPRDPYRITP
jgi:aspartyl-tRNA synthetase